MNGVIAERRQTARLDDRGIVGVAGTDAVKLLQGLVTNDLDGMKPGLAVFTGLLSPQGKILFDFFAVYDGERLLLDVRRDRAADLVKRLTMYKLRADVEIADRSSEFAVFVSPDTQSDDPGAAADSLAFTDPRDARLGRRLIVPRTAGDHTRDTSGSTDAYHAHRVALGIPEGGTDYDFGDAYPHEANFDLLNGVSFAKGCYVGQEVVARMQNKTVVRKRVVRIAGDAQLTSGADINLGDAVIGRIGTTAGSTALAMLRLDRALEAQDKGVALQTHGQTLRIVDDSLIRYAAGVAAAPPPNELPR